MQDFHLPHVSPYQVASAVGWVMLFVIFYLLISARRSGGEGDTDKAPAAAPDSEPQCPDKLLHEVAKTDLATIDRLVRIPWIIYQPHFEGKEPYVDFAVVVFNNSLYDILIDNSIKGDIWCDTSGDPFHYDPKIYPTRPIACRSRRGASFTIRHPLTVGEVSRFKGRDDALIWFDGLEITFAGIGESSEIGAMKLNTKGFCLETKKGAYRNPNDKDEFAFLYTDEQWALLASSKQQEVAALKSEIDSLKSQLVSVESEKATPNFCIPENRIGDGLFCG